MIVVIADDFSGAAEIAGVGWRYGLDCEIQTEPDLAHQSRDLIVIDTDTRSLPVNEAKIKLKQIIHQITSWPYHWLYKKVDSVLRGHVLAELTVILDHLNLRKVLLIPANPTTGRIIKEQKYYINNLPLHQTEFAEDPEFPVKSSRIVNLLGNSADSLVKIFDEPEALAENGIVVGSVQSVNQLNEWAVCVSHDILAAGGAEFFQALLMSKIKKMKIHRQLKPLDRQSKQLFVIGSAAGQKDNDRLQAISRRRIICPIPVPEGAKLILSESRLAEWITQINGAFHRYRQVVAVSGVEDPDHVNIIKKLPTFMAGMVAGVIDKTIIDHLIISGGSTASKIIRTLSWTKLIPVNEVSPGIVMLKVKGIPAHHLIVKPGSYPWPEQLYM